ncbi:bifunctional nuclease family protein [Myxococcota bacterium]|nr:bifunctional nuclease family protein [Myxococcota bacterium]
MARPHRVPSASRAQVLATLVALGLGLACGAPAPEAIEDIVVRVSGVAVDRTGSPVVILEEQDGGRALPIWIGVAEARSIASEIERLHPPRPNAHDLAKRLIESLDGAIERVVVTELRDGTYYARILVSAHGQRREVDARPSDAIALALRFDAPLLVREALFDDASREPGAPAEERAL